MLRRDSGTRRGGYCAVRFQLQMPPDLHGQRCMRVSNAWASSGSPCRGASFARAVPCGRAWRRGVATRTRAALWTGAAVSTGALTSCTATFLGSVFSAARAHQASLLRSVSASTAIGANSVGGPSGFGESTACERSRPRNWSGRYSSAIDAPLETSKAAPTNPRKVRFRIITFRPKYLKQTPAPFRKPGSALPAGGLSEDQSI